MKFAVCDDEKIFREEIIAHIYAYFGKLDCQCVEFSAGEELFRYMEKSEEGSPDAVFLDIEMAGMDGLETAARLRKQGAKMPIIFLTSHTELAMDGYEVAAFRFCGKPIRKEKLEKTLYDLNELLFKKKKVMIRYEGEDIVLALDEMIYVEAMNNSIRIVMTDREYVIRRKLSDFGRELEAQTCDFVKIHKSYIVNLAHTKKLHGKEVLMTGDISLPISRSVVNSFKERLFDFVRNSAR